MNTPPCAAFTPTATATSTPGRCVGDCNGDGHVTVDELLAGINFALGNATVDGCHFDLGGHDTVTVDELALAVNAAFNGCRSVTGTSQHHSQAATRQR